MNAEQLQEILDSILTPAGFRRHKHTWHKTNDDTITLLDLQKSRWGGQYYVNLAVYLRDLGSATSPSEYESHIRVRMTAIAGHEAAAVDEALDLERSGISAAHRKDVLLRAVTAIALPFLADRSAVSRLRDLYAAGELGPVLMTKTARDLLEGALA